MIYKNKAQRPPLFTVWLLFLGISLVSLIFSFDKIISLKELARLLSIFLIYLSSFYLIKKNKDFVLLVKIIIFSAVIPGSLAIYQYFTNTGLSVPLENIYNRIYGTFSHPNLFAYYLIIPITLSILIFLIGKKEKIVNILILSLSLFFILLLGLTFTRGAWLAFIIIVLIIGIIQYRILLLTAFIIFFLSYLFIPPIHSRINDLHNAKKGNSIEWRQTLWRDALSYIKDKPVIGYGVGTANKIILEKRGERMGSSDPHNDYLKISIENGLLGLASYLILIISTLFYLIKDYFKTEQLKLKTVNLTVFALFFALITMSFADNIIRNTALQWTLWSLIGGLMGMNHFKNTKNRIEKIIDKQ
ncbi:O-antigen ligase family protein [Candidatus Parcubacteria bacterium]|nr:O-antigen ligase family protein [Patescibacteria group bacterium]MBU4308959.1 O-antigen ligase family protein [Patescibacteria group bacterium]MBU4431870.1 O-antigen ligase family protein [Patescibacteria group bacterium]MBU4577319.1 O-antigen ligase family protein [Patescibacteria group bacterium]MCG2697008.1 O-antigen ligase family protein [Candidatus Parcubacteria bacterium]